MTATRRLGAAALLLVLTIGIVYGQTARHGFIDVDDGVYVAENPVVARGLSRAGFRWAFGIHERNWHPLTWLSHMFDVELFGLRAGGHHLANAALHAVNAVLLMALLAALTGSAGRSAAVAAVFALHPLRVEAVAWAAERKEVLAALLGLLALAAYARYARRPTLPRYLATLSLFALGLLAKPMLVTLPFVLLLLDWWPLGRVVPPDGAPAAGRAGRVGWLAAFAEKLPFLALSLLSALVTLRAQAADVQPLVAPALPLRLANAAHSCLAYVGSFLWPANLALFYPYPRSGFGWASNLAAAAALALPGVLAARFWKRCPWLAFGWLWFLGTLVPVLGFVQVGGQARADRYTYLPLIGVAVAAVWLAGDLSPRAPRARRRLAALLAVVLAALAAASFSYTRAWRDSLTLFARAVGATEGNYVMLNNLGAGLIREGRHREAAAALREAVRIEPGHCNALYNLGVGLVLGGRPREALEPLHRALACVERATPGLVPDTRYTLGTVYAGLGLRAEAARHFREALRLQPGHRGARAGLEEIASRGEAPPGGAGLSPSRP